ncbi:MAG: hypothetical protein ACRD8O_11255 [Bryobacteraceae bacterium]
MPSKKKPKPQFEIPEDVKTPSGSGWVYQSDERAAPPRRRTAPTPPPRPHVPSSLGIVDAGSQVVVHGVAALGNIVLFTTRVVTMPLNVAMRLLR